MWRIAFLPVLLAAASTTKLPPGRTSLIVARPPERVTIPAGPFRMGASPAELKTAYALCTDEYRAVGAAIVEASLRCAARFEAEAPQRTVFLPAYAIDRTEVTVGAYRACVRKGACAGAPLVEARRMLAGDAFPVEAVTWSEAVAYCRFRGGRLPSEAEWEKAARGTLGLTWPWGDRWDGARANHGRRGRSPNEGGEAGSDGGGEGDTDATDGAEGASPAGAFPGGASPYGVVDAAGNLWEWTDGVYEREPPQAATSFMPPGPLAGTERVVRGGSYATPASDLRVTRRLGLPPGERHLTVGFRCVYDRPGP
jgi:formylglycine-generating enzyme required for sulfatase activity